MNNIQFIAKGDLLLVLSTVLASTELYEEY